MNSWKPFRASPLVSLMLLSFALTLTAAANDAARVTPGELAQKAQWVQQHLLSADAALPFSLIYDKRPCNPASWTRENSYTALDNRRTERLLTWTDRQTGLAIRCRAVEYQDFPTIEWTLTFKNTGAQQTPILADIRPLDIRLVRGPAGEFVLHHQTGDNYSAHSYEPHVATLGPKSVQSFAPVGGRPTNGAYPYFNLQYDGGGLIAVVGWPGQWSARFVRDAADGLRVSAGQELTHFKLLPGEEVRSPLIVLQFYSGDRVRSQNVWRRWMVAHNLPRPGGKLPPPFTSACMGVHQSAAGEIAYIDAYLKGGAKLDYWWMDAGWYPCRDWWETGTWQPDPKRFPKGIREVSDHAHSKDMKTVLWFEPERVHQGSWLFEKHPEWLLGKGGDRLLNLGNPEARKWLTDHIDKFLTEQGIDLYRQDFNFDPLGIWRESDAVDRQGIAEIRHVEGYLAFWDELRRRHPGLLIDSCASGGRRNDLETLRRAVPLLRSDFQAPQNPSAPDILVGNQGHTYGLSFWVPYYGTGVFCDNVYAVRSHLTPSQGIGCQADAGPAGWAKMRRRMQDWKTVAGYFYGDYYPLTPYTLSEAAWIGWQFHIPGTGEGMIQAFRHARSEESSLRLPLHGLAADGVYELKDLDLERSVRASGRELMEKGLLVTLPRRPQAALIAYRRRAGLAAVIAASEEKCETLQAIRFCGKDSRASGGEIAEYLWDFGDRATASGPAAEHAYQAPGTYTVRLTVKDRQGAADTTEALVAVLAVDTVPPLLTAVTSGKPDRVVATFSKPVEKGFALDLSHYAIGPEKEKVHILSATLGADLVTVTLATSPLSEERDYILAVHGVKDRARTPHVIAADSRRTFRYRGLYAWWRLDEGQGETAVDSSGNGHDAVFVGERGPKWVRTPRGPALSFQGAGGYLESDSFFPDLAMPFSITLWVNPAAAQLEYADIFGNHGEPYVGVSLQQNGKETNSYGFGYGDGKRWQGVGNVQLKAGCWQHVAVVCDGRTALLYVDGVQKARAPAVGPMAPNPGQNFKLGQGYHSGRFFHGELRDVRIHRKALSAAQIEELARERR